MAQTYEKIAERIISGKGVLKPPTAVQEARSYLLYLDVVRLPKNLYLNKNWNPDRSRYATLVFLRNEYVINDVAVEYPQTVFDGINDIAGQNLIALKCAYEGILTTFVNLGLALGAPPISYMDQIKDYENLQLSWDEVRIKCYADTAIIARLYALKYDTCSPSKIKNTPPPPKPPPIPPVPPGTPIGSISPPYDGANNDSGNTQPYSGDEVEPPQSTPPLPFGNTCSRYRVSWTFDQVSTVNNSVTTYNDSTNVWGQVQNIRLTNTSTGSGTEIFCRGGTLDSCGTLKWYARGGVGTGNTSLRFVNLRNVVILAI